MALLLLLVAIVAMAWGVSQKRSLKAAKGQLQEFSRRYKPAMDIERHVQLEEERVQNLLKQQEQIRSDIESAKQGLTRIHEELELASDAAFLVEVGYYEPRYDFEDLPSYEAELRQIREKQKAMLRIDGTGNDRAAIDGTVDKRASAAAYIKESISFNGVPAKGKALQRQILKLMLRAFNGESDSFIARVNYRNAEAMERRIRAAYDSINAMTEKSIFCKLNSNYLNLRLQELRLVYEWEEAKQREKEEQARIREQMREEEKAAREAEKAQQQADKEESKYQELLQKAEQEVLQASEKDKVKLNEKIEELQQRIAEIEDKKRAISQAMLTKTGHVYIISNVGSFGENVFKIGMTRRLEPMDRVKELGDASVPFPFDVHAMIRTSDAPALENALHNHFEMRRLNLENQRKEFFHVSIDEIRQELNQLTDQLGIDSELRLTLLAEAKEYRMSEAKRKHLEKSWHESRSSAPSSD